MTRGNVLAPTGPEQDDRSIAEAPRHGRHRQRGSAGFAAERRWLRSWANRPSCAASARIQIPITCSSAGSRSNGRSRACRARGVTEDPAFADLLVNRRSFDVAFRPGERLREDLDALDRLWGPRLEQIAIGRHRPEA
jgi:hypothetical protein